MPLQYEPHGSKKGIQYTDRPQSTLEKEIIQYGPTTVQTLIQNTLKQQATQTQERHSKVKTQYMCSISQLFVYSHWPAIRSLLSPQDRLTVQYLQFVGRDRFSDWCAVYIREAKQLTHGAGGHGLEVPKAPHVSERKIKHKTSKQKERT